jgi:diguanylate cyclase (GGDEF)-like protein
VAFGVRNRKAERGGSELELLRGLIKLANQLQSSLELDGVVHVIATALNDTFGFREASVYLREPGEELFRVRATVGEHPDYDDELFQRPIPPHIWDELFLEKYQIGSSYFVDHHMHTWTEEQLYYLPALDLGARKEGEWTADDDLLVPLYDQRRRLMGVLDLYDPADRRPPSLELVKSLEVFATHAAVAIENALQVESLEKTSSQLEAQLALRQVLLELSKTLLSSLDERDVFERIAALVKQIVDYDALEIRLVDQEAQELYCGYASDSDLEEMLGWRSGIDEGVSGWVVQHNEAQLVNDMLADERGALVPGTELEPQASIIVPLTVGDEVIGVLALDRMGGHTFDEHEFESAKLFANLAAIAIRNARQYEQLEQTSRQLEEQLGLRHELLEMSGVLLANLEQQDVLEEIAERLGQIVAYDTMGIDLVDEARRELVPIYARDQNADAFLEFRMSIDEGVSGWVVRHDQAQLVNDMDKDPRAVFVPGTEEGEPQACILVPLRVRDTVIGVLTMDRLGGATFEEHELEPAILFANLAAIAIQNARAYEEMERQAISDGLTGIHNHRHFHDTLRSTVSRAGRYDESFCLLMMDLDRFKAVNDTIGHQQGDEVLRQVADVLRTCSRESDYLARYGGEEFAMILPRTELSEAQTMAERVRAGVSDIHVGRSDLHVTMSIGVASYPESARDADGILGAADAALLRAKARGRDQVCLAGEGQAAVARDLEGELVALGRRFAAFISLTEAETAGLLTALAVHETGGAVQEEVQAILAAGENGGAESGEVRHSAVEALIYGNERWDGTGYPEGRRGDAIPRVARAYAVCRRYDVATHNGHSLEALRAKAARELDPKMVQRFASMLKAEKAGHN